MTADPELSLTSHFAELTDPRIDRSRLHELLDIVTIAICAVVAGADSWEHIEQFARAKHDWLKTFLALPNGVPSHDTFARVFARCQVTPTSTRLSDTKCYEAGRAD